jgi:hypothetical protein
MEKQYKYTIFTDTCKYHVYVQYIWNAAGKFARLDLIIQKKPVNAAEFTEEFRQFYRRAGICNFFVPTMLLYRNTNNMQWLLRELIIPLTEKERGLWRSMTWEMPELDKTDQIAKAILN